MPRVPHWLHVYDKPAVGSAFRHKFAALNYRHKISANGGFDTASCEVGVDRAEAEFIFGNLVGNRVAVYADNPVVPIWEGLISRVTIVASGAERTRSLEDMANRVVVEHTGGVLNMMQTAEVTDDASIALFGSKMKTFDAGEMYAEATSFAEALRDARLTQLAYPPVSTVSGGGGDYRVSLELIGFYHTLMWDTFEVVDTGTVSNAPAEILIDGTGDDYSYNYNIFYDADDASRISSTAFSINNSRQLGESSWDLLLRIAEAGDSGTRRIVGIAETNPNTGERIAYYEDADETVKLTTYAYGDGRIYTTGGQAVNPWDVRPNRSIRLNDILIGQPDGASDAKTAYITSVDYDAENGSVSWITDDNITLEGVFNLDKESNATNERFGAERRSALLQLLGLDQGGTEADLSATGPGLLYQPSAGAGIEVSDARWASHADPLILNTHFNIWQDGTSFTHTGGMAYWADGWAGRRNNNAAGMTISRQTVEAGNCRYAFRMQRDSGNSATDGLHMIQSVPVEQVVPVQSVDMTLALRIRVGANFSGTNVQIEVRYATTADVTPEITAGTTALASDTISPTTAFAVFTLDFTVPATAKNLQFRIGYTPTGTAGAADYLEVDWVGTHFGSGITVEPKPLPRIADLIQCQQQYLKTYAPGSAPGAVTSVNAVFFSTRIAIAASTAGLLLPAATKFPTQLRTTPTVTLYSVDGTSGAVRNASAGANRTGCTASQVGADGFAYIDVSNASTTVISLDNTIGFHYVANARL